MQPRALRRTDKGAHLLALLKADRAKAEGAVIGPCGMNSRAVGQSQPRYRKAVLRN